jgi:hypothetical protein
MKGAKFITTLLFFSIAVAFTGCPEPVGSLLYTADYIMPDPKKQDFGQDEWFIPTDKDQKLKIIGIFSGQEEEIDLGLVDIKIIQDPGFSDEKIIINPMFTDQNGFILDKDVGLPLSETGKKKVVINYKNLKTSYSIFVGDPEKVQGGWGSGDKDGTGIGIIWLN